MKIANLILLTAACAVSLVSGGLEEDVSMTDIIKQDMEQVEQLALG